MFYCDVQVAERLGGSGRKGLRKGYTTASCERLRREEGGTRRAQLELRRRLWTVCSLGEGC